MAIKDSGAPNDGRRVPFARKSVPAPDAQVAAVANQAFVNTQTTGIPLVNPLVDQTRVGSFWVRLHVSIPISGGNIAHQLGRTPSAYIVVDNRSGNVIYRTAGDVALAGPSNIFLRSFPSATVASLLIG